MKKAYTFDDILLVPQYSTIRREDEDVNIESFLYDHFLRVPIISAPMDTVTGYEMVIKLRENSKALGIHHRVNTSEELQQLFFKDVPHYGGIAVGPSMDLDKIINYAYSFFKTITCVLDVAHGHTQQNLAFCAELVRAGISVISGNIATPKAAEDYLKIGVKVLRVGIGAGSVCSTRMVTGVGVPQATAVKTIRTYFPKAYIISDGGHRTTGDIVKALALGADFVMLGNMLSGTNEVPEKGKQVYRGMASKNVLEERKKDFFVEGVAKEVKSKGSVIEIIDEIEKAIKQACYYTGCRNIKELRKTPIMFVTNNAYKEGTPHY